MPNVQLVLIMLLMATAVVAAYFYLKRAQHRDAAKMEMAPRTEDVAQQPVAQAASPSSANSSTPTETQRSR